MAIRCPLAARELVRVPHAVFAESPTSGQLVHRSSISAAGQPLRDERLGDDVLHEHARVERVRRILEHDLDLLAQLQEPPAVHPDQIDLRKQFLRAGPFLGIVRGEHPLDLFHFIRRPSEVDSSRGCVVQPEDGLAERGLSAAGFTDQPEALTPPNLEIHAVERLRPPRGAEHAGFDGYVLHELAISIRFSTVRDAAEPFVIDQPLVHSFPV